MTTNTAYEILGIGPSELAGYSVEEIAEFIRDVQGGTQDGDMTDEEINAVALQIYEEVNS